MRCKNCLDVLEQDAKACVICGTLTGEGGEHKTTNGVASSSVAPNTIEFRETHKSRSLRATFTDEVGKDLNKTVNLLLSSRIRINNNLPQFSEEVGADEQKQLLATTGIIETPDEDIGTVIDSTISDGVQQPPEKKDTDRLSKIFRLEGTQLKLIDPRLKANSKVDFARRLSILFLYAHALNGKTRVPRSDLNNVLNQCSVYDSNARKWISNTPHLLVDNDLLELSVLGRERAIEILDEIVNPDLPNSWELGTTSRKRNGRRGSAEDKTTEGAKSNSKKSSKKSKTTSSRKLGPTQLLDDLITQGFFNEKRILNDIIKHSSSSLAYHYKPNQLSPILTRFVRDKKLKREKNSDGQYEYFT